MGATAMGARLGLLVVGLAVVGGAALVMALTAVRETRAGAPLARGDMGTGAVFARMTWGDRRLAALSQAGLVEKFVDALVWIVLPVWLFARGLSLTQIGWVTGTYGMVWGVAQLWTGRLSDRVGRYWPNVGGMWVCGAGVAMYPLGEGMVWWMAASGVTGMGMALLYPNLSAAVADIAPPAWRGRPSGSTGSGGILVTRWARWRWASRWGGRGRGLLAGRGGDGPVGRGPRPVGRGDAAR